MAERPRNAGMWPPLRDPFRQLATQTAQCFSPASGAEADEEACVLTLKLPGIGEDDIDITGHECMLTVTGEKNAEQEEEGESSFFPERQFGSFRRGFRLPAVSDPDADTADPKNGG